MAAPHGPDLVPFACRGCGVVLAFVDTSLASFRIERTAVGLYISRDGTKAELRCPNRACRTVNRLQAVPTGRQRSGRLADDRLTAAERCELKRRSAAGEGQTALARRFGISQPRVSQLLRDAHLDRDRSDHDPVDPIDPDRND